jgi:RNA polymerase sigma-70 factor (ECF subfamily)
MEMHRIFNRVPVSILTPQKNKEQFAEEFERSSGQLKSFILRITASVADAEDIVQDTFIKGAEKLDTFKGHSSLRTWLFAIASNIAKDNFKSQKTMGGTGN